jgi:hypothetical protein
VAVQTSDGNVSKGQGVSPNGLSQRKITYNVGASLVAARNDGINHARGQPQGVGQPQGIAPTKNQNQI